MAQIVTFGTMAARGVIRDVGRVMNIPYAEVDQIAKQVPNALHITLEDALRLSKPLRELYDTDERVKKLIDTAKALEGMPRHASTHAAGVVITRRPVYEYVPLAKNDDAVVCQYVMTTLEELGLLKMDFLGLRNLTVLDDAVKMVQEHEPDFRLEDIPEDDPETFAMLSAGKPSGVFQVESAGMTGVCVGLKPRSIEDITAIIALYRPGPMDSIPRFIACSQDPSKIKYLHPSLEPISPSPTAASSTRSRSSRSSSSWRATPWAGGHGAPGHEQEEGKDIEREREAFLHGDPERNITGGVAMASRGHRQAIYQDIYDFANYASTRPTPFLCRGGLPDRLVQVPPHPGVHGGAADLRSGQLRQGGRLHQRVPGVRHRPAAAGHQPLRRPLTVRRWHPFGLVAIKNIGRGFILSVMEERKKAPFRSLQDFCERMGGGDINKRAVENLIRSGAFDSTGARRSQLIQVYESIMDAVADSLRQNLEGQLDFFSMAVGQQDAAPVKEIPLPDIPEFTPQELMTMEKATTGLYLSGHPMDQYREEVKALRAPTMASILEDFARRGDPPALPTTSGSPSAASSPPARQDHEEQLPQAYVTLEDDTASMELLCFARC